jgi:uridine kinase
MKTKQSQGSGIFVASSFVGFRTKRICHGRLLRYLHRVPVQNRIVKVQKRNRALVRFDGARIYKAILRAAESIGGFHKDFLPGTNEKIFEAYGADASIAEFLSDTVVVCLNSDPHHLISNFPPRIETIQDEVLHALRSYGFQNTADAYGCYRWGRHWMREGAISKEQFIGNGFRPEQMQQSLEWNRAHGCDTVAGLNEIVRNGTIKSLVAASLAVYESSLDAAAAKFISRLNSGNRIRMLWVSGPSCSGKTTTTVKLTQRLERQGLRFLMLNLDDYFWSLVEHPTDWINDRNYETPEALDIQLLNEHLKTLLAGGTIEKPIYSFKEGRCIGTKPIRLEPDQVLLLDCLHGFYPPITEGIQSSVQFRLYIETQNMLYEGDGSSKCLTRFTDLRLMRRMLRDASHRNHSPLRTILHWHYVRAGELFDLAALQPSFVGAKGILPKPGDFESYAGFLDAQIRYEKVKGLLESVEGLSGEQLSSHGLIPGDAVIREFIGGSTVRIPHNE